MNETKWEAGPKRERERNLRSRDLCMHVMGAIIGTWKQQKSVLYCVSSVRLKAFLFLNIREKTKREDLRETT